MKDKLGNSGIESFKDSLDYIVKMLKDPYYWIWYIATLILLLILRPFSWLE